MAIPTWLPVSIQTVALIVTISVFMWQIHRARFNQSVDLLFKLEADFFGPAKRAQRARAAKDLLEGKLLEAEPILDFFETMALLLRRGALDTELVKHTFFYWIDNYYEASRSLLAARQRVNPLIWKDLTPFVETLRKRHAGQLKTSFQPPTTEQIAAFLQEELTDA